MLELDLLLQGFFQKAYDGLEAEEKAAFHTLLDCPDQELLEYLLGRETPLDNTLAHIVEQIRYAAHS